MLDWPDLSGWDTDDHAAALAAFRVSENQCALGKGAVSAKSFFETHFEPVEIAPTGEAHLTGYYEPEVSGSRLRSDQYAHPLYAIPPGIEPTVPWFSRAEIAAGGLLVGLELVYLETAIEAFLAQVQGSIRVRLAEGGSLRLGFAGKNGHPYASIGKELVARGVASVTDMTPALIRQWCAENPDDVQTLLNTNPSFVFFKLLDIPESSGPIGAMGCSVTAGRSLAVDPDIIALGSPVWIETADTGGRLVIAQDIGSAIKGAGRGDLFFGTGDAAGKAAGALNTRGRMVVLRRRA